MSNKLFKGRRPFFNVEKQAEPQKRRTVVTLPFPPEAVQQLLVVVRKHDGSVDVAGPIEQPETCLKMMKEGMAKVILWNERQNKSAIEVHQHLPPGLKDVVVQG